MNDKIDIVIKYDELAIKANDLTVDELRNAFNDETPKQDSDPTRYVEKNTDFYLEKYNPLFQEHLHRLAQQSMIDQINRES
ncbi:hypothetical protein [Mammaliicoccus sciuri]|mgnify:CR=1 FL=1|uniref:hypothetical protein n=1 Tax=Mammaliicoccus sciuri TaxID=1296 RepID=UPI000D1EC2FB|nr:hypothetical protein [Mammaliicoccus sciuri]PTK01936.1 hypothetical protein BUZ87_06265 [Mammaliicoccus sciuri]RIN83770.1 hypothetical protein BU004_12435 [Mammaliicoccus sciuri]